MAGKALVSVRRSEEDGFNLVGSDSSGRGGLNTGSGGPVEGQQRPLLLLLVVVMVVFVVLSTLLILLVAQVGVQPAIADLLKGLQDRLSSGGCVFGHRCIKVKEYVMKVLNLGFPLSVI